MSARIRLTPQQQAIVDHNRGPALVYAVAGAGKTTAMVHRIARLVRDDVFSARHILATSFNKDANRQIETALYRRPGCREVRVRTLHALGYSVIKLAIERGYLPAANLSAAGRNPGAAGRQILFDTLARIRNDRSNLASLLDTLDYDDFLAFVQRSKASLAFPDPPRDLPRRARRTLGPLRPPDDRPWYRELYRAFEQTRTSAGLLTFDDFLSTAWETLARHDDILGLIQRRHRCVMVDEFQDVNRAQAEMLDLLTKRERNYMVIGDDDQTIYEWRGASPFFIRGFRKRYRAPVYFMTDNFRSRASQVALANQVIRHDTERQDKYLQLTQGFGGHTQVTQLVDEESIAESIAQTVLQLHGDGFAYAEMAVLVRIYNQTGAIEHALRQASIPFAVVNETDAQPRIDGITVTSIYRAKGLEWPVVFIPGCNDGLLPYAQTGNLAEERRLFYVAVTRAQQQLYLYARQDRPLTPYLESAGHAVVLNALARIEDALARDPATWTPDDFLAVAVNAKRLYLHEYFLHWWDTPLAVRQRVAEAVLRYYATLRRRRRLRALDITRADIALWRAVAGVRVREEPLDEWVLG